MDDQPDPTNPPHYRQHPSGVECIDITEHMSFNLGNALKYIWRFPYTGELTDLQKAIWYIQRELQRLAPLDAPRKDSDAPTLHH